MSLNSIAILLIAIGIASDNLMFAGVNGKGFQLTKNTNCFLTLLFLLILQVEMLMCVNKIALSASVSEAQGKGLPLLILFSAGIIILYHCFDKKWRSEYLMLEKWQLLHQGFATSLLVLASGFAIRLIFINNVKFDLYMIPLLLVFIATGLLLGMLNKITTLKRLHSMGAICFACGLLLLLIKYLNFNNK